MKTATKERFEKHIYYSIDNCWYWTGYIGICRRQKNRARFGINGRNRPAARVAYELYIGEIPAGMCVCHSCDNPMCVNPNHLFIGTQLDNVADRNKKGRTACGLTKPKTCKLTEAAVREIRSSNERAVDLAARFNIKRRHIYDIKSRKNWKHLL